VSAGEFRFFYCHEVQKNSCHDSTLKWRVNITQQSTNHISFSSKKKYQSSQESTCFLFMQKAEIANGGTSFPPF
jgi:hypothetical protein